MLHSQSKFSRASKSSGAILLLAALAACGGGSGADPVVGGPPGVTPGPAPAPLTLGGLNCVAATGGGTGYVLGVCSVSTTVGGVTSEQISSSFQNLPVIVTTDASVSNRFGLSVQTPLTPGSKSLDGTTENCAGNQLGSKVGYLSEVFDDATKPATSPRFTILSFVQQYGDNTANCRTTLNTKKNGVLTGFVHSDLGTWERYLGEAALYYGGWYALRGTANAVPAAGKTYSTAGAAFGYRFTPALGYGLSGDVVNGATWNGTAITLQINNFTYSRAGQANPNPGEALPTLSLTSSTVVGNKVTGIVSGTGVTGIWEAEFAGPAGQEFAGKFQLVQGSSGNKVTGSFAVR